MHFYQALFSISTFALDFFLPMQLENGLEESGTQAIERLSEEHQPHTLDSQAKQASALD